MQDIKPKKLKGRAKLSHGGVIGEDLLQDVHGTKKLLNNMAKNYGKVNTSAVYSVADKNRQELLVEEEVAGHWKEYFEELMMNYL